MGPGVSALVQFVVHRVLKCSAICPDEIQQGLFVYTCIFARKWNQYSVVRVQNIPAVVINLLGHFGVRLVSCQVCSDSDASRERNININNIFGKLQKHIACVDILALIIDPAFAKL